MSKSRIRETTSVPEVPAPPGFGEINIGPIQAIPITLASHGVDPEIVMRNVGVAPALFESSTNRIDIAVLVQLLEACIAVTGIPHFCLLVGAHYDLEMLGPVGILMKNETSVREALRVQRLNSRLHNRAAGINLIEISNQRCALTYGVFASKTPAVGLIYELAAIIGIKNMKSLCGDDWRPAEVRLSRRTPSATDEYLRLFEAPVFFDEPLTMIVFDKTWLDAPVVNADIERRNLYRRLFAQAPPATLAEKILRVLCNGLMAGDADIENVARLFSMSVRTLQRRLADEGTSLKILTSEARSIVCRQLLTSTAMPIAEISAAIGYSHPAAFVRAFRKTMGQNPSSWRKSQAAFRASSAQI
jgi:AraC-like DNA-binding protein